MTNRSRRRTVAVVATTDRARATHADAAGTAHSTADSTADSTGGGLARGGAGPPLSGRARRTGGWWRELAIAIAVAAFQVLVTRKAGDNQPEHHGLDALGVVLLVTAAAPLVIRRRWPVATYLMTFAATLAYWLTDNPRGPVFVALIIAFQTVASSGYRLLAWGSLAVGYVAFAWVRPIYSDEPWPNLAQGLGLAAWLLVLGTVVEIVSTRRERAAELRHTQAEEARRRASEERLLIARELHDVLAHNISLINVQAGVALHLLDERPDQARPALAAIKDASKEALGELRSVLDILRQADDGSRAPRAPTAGLRDLGGLVERTRAAGLDVRLETEGEARPVPAGVDLAAFRIAQEALTNVVRHAAADRATVRLTYGDDELRVQVDDDGRGAAAAPPASGDPPAHPGGRGVAGMQERVHALGGRFEAGPRPGRGFRVRAFLPIAAAPDTPPQGDDPAGRP
jgi:signal transduction histidine kinase